ncbi:MAG: hypothetical protein HYZ49_12955 [Chloroflexi bacterium]|nr:hypothetical protein [Chloroflexota bacterium]
MNTLKIAVIATVAVLAIAALGAGFVFAQTQTPPAPWGNGYGMMGGNSGYGMMGGSAGMTPALAPGASVGNFAQNGDGYASLGVNNMHQWMTTNGARSVHTLVWNGLADALNLTPDGLNEQLASGKTLTQIAEAQGVSQEQLAAALETSAKAGLDKAVADGALTQAQADQMLGHMAGNYAWMISQMGAGAGTGFGPGGCHGNFVPPSNS